MYYRMRILAFTFLTSCVSISNVIAPAAPKPWYKGVVYYQIEKDLPEKTKKEILSAMQEWTTLTEVVRFVERTDQKNYVVFTDEEENSCAAHVGMIGGEQEVNLSKGCGYGATLHEIGHLLGLRHEHQRPDRNDYISVDWDQLDITPTIIYNFMRYPRHSYPEYLGPYDYDSIMHYDAYDFSSTNKPTIIFPENLNRPFFVNKITPLDIQKVKMLYKRETSKVLIELNR